MPKLPLQPDLDWLRSLEPAVHTVEAGTLLWRVYFRGGAHPVDWADFRFFGPLPHGRFDHHRGTIRGTRQEGATQQERGILYAAEAALTTLAEVFQNHRIIDRHHRHPWLAGFRTQAPLQLLDLTGTFPTRAGASMAIASGPRSVARRWAQAFYSAYPDLQGLYYPSSMNAHAPMLALNERAQHIGCLPANPEVHRSLADELLLTVVRNAAHELGYGLV